MKGEKEGRERTKRREGLCFWYNISVLYSSWELESKILMSVKVSKFLHIHDFDFCS